ncbi:MAG: hypothetical protein AAF337_04840 [Pseudomonadota bacterium]
MTIVVERYFSQDVSLTTAFSLKQALDHLEHHMPDIVLLDYRLRPYHDCSHSLPAIRAAGFDGPIHVWSTLDKAITSVVHSAPDVASLICKLDFPGLRLKDLLQHQILGFSGQASEPSFHQPALASVAAAQ